MNQSAQRYETNEPISSEIWNVGKWDTLHSLLAIRPHILPYLPPKKGGQVTGEEYRTDKEAAEGGGGVNEEGYVLFYVILKTGVTDDDPDCLLPPDKYGTYTIGGWVPTVPVEIVPPLYIVPTEYPNNASLILTLPFIVPVGFLNSAGLIVSLPSIVPMEFVNSAGLIVPLPSIVPAEYPNNAGLILPLPFIGPVELPNSAGLIVPLPL